MALIYLPFEILSHIFQFLSDIDLVSLSNANGHFDKLTENIIIHRLIKYDVDYESLPFPNGTRDKAKLVALLRRLPKRLIFTRILGHISENNYGWERLIYLPNRTFIIQEFEVKGKKWDSSSDLCDGEIKFIDTLTRPNYDLPCDINVEEYELYDHETMTLISNERWNYLSEKYDFTLITESLTLSEIIKLLTTLNVKRSGIIKRIIDGLKGSAKTEDRVHECINYLKGLMSGVNHH